MCIFILHCWLLAYYTNILWDATTLQCRLIGATQILEQISENEQERLFELERKDQENIQMQKYLEKLMEEDRNKLEKKAAEQHLLRVYIYDIYLSYAIAAVLVIKQLKDDGVEVIPFQIYFNTCLYWSHCFI